MVMVMMIYQNVVEVVITMIPVNMQGGKWMKANWVKVLMARKIPSNERT